MKCFNGIIRRCRRFKNRQELNAWIKEHNKGQIPPNKGVKTIPTDRKCYACGSTASYFHKKTGKTHWAINLDNNGNALQFLCTRCNNRYITNPKYNPIYTHNRFTFRGEEIHLHHNPRTGFCSQCGNVGRTHLHHEKYDSSNPNSHTVELCMSCHMKRSWQLGQLGAGVST